MLALSSSQARMSRRPIIVCLAVLGLALGLFLSLDDRSAEPCGSCLDAPYALGDCGGADGSMACQPCPAACAAGMSVVTGDGQPHLPRFVAFPAEPAAQFASLNHRPSHAPPRPATFH